MEFTSNTQTRALKARQSLLYHRTWERGNKKQPP
nr:MAG TPA: hypothetical protein [Caudoviricetes sp.]